MNAQSEALVNQIADALQAHDFSDWYHALLCQALDAVQDVEQAIAVADAAYESCPQTPDVVDEVDDGTAEEAARYVRGQQTPLTYAAGTEDEQHHWHAPEGGIDIAGVFYAGGKFIPSDAVAGASIEERSKLLKAQPASSDLSRAEQETDRQSDSRPGSPVDDLHEHITGLLAGKSPGHAAIGDLTDRVMKLTIPQIKELASRLKTQLKGKLKADLVAYLVEQAMAAAGPRSGKSAEESEKTEKPEKTEDSKKSVPSPRPPSPGHTGTDTLGRKWQDGELTGEVDPLPDSQPLPFRIDPERKFDLAKLVTGEPLQLTEQDIADLKTIGLVRDEYHSRPQVSASAVRPHEEAVKRLQANELLERKQAKGNQKPWRGIQELTDRGAAALAMIRFQGNQAGDPVTRKAIDDWKHMYNILAEPQRARIREHFGIHTDDRQQYFWHGKFEKDLTRAVGSHHNPPIAQRIRQASAAQDVVAHLSHMDRDAFVEGHQATVDALMRLRFAGRALNDLRPSIDLEKYRRGVEEFDKASNELFNARNKRQAEFAEQCRQHLLLPEGSRTKVTVPWRDSTVSAETGKHVDEAATWLDGLVARGRHGEHMPPYGAKFTRMRAHYESSTHMLNVGDGNRKTQVHEMGHGIEYKMPGVQQAANDFLDHRLAGETPTKLNTLPGGELYGDDEYGARDRFHLHFGDGSRAYYAGKRYGDGATEVISMGVEELYNDPGGFCCHDPEFATFIIGILDGSLRNREIPRE